MFDDDVSAFFSTEDFAITAEFKGESAPVIFGTSSSFVNHEVAETVKTSHSFLKPSHLWKELKKGDNLLIEGHSYVVVRSALLDDGKLERVDLNKV